MLRYKVYLKSGTVITINADDLYVGGSSHLILSNGALETYQQVAVFAPGMWEGWQLLTLAPKETEKSGS